jgi:hypothetical protein
MISTDGEKMRINHHHIVLTFKFNGKAPICFFSHNLSIKRVAFANQNYCLLAFYEML